MRVMIYCTRNNDYGDHTRGDAQTIEVEDLEACFRLPDNKLLVIDSEEKYIYDDCKLIGMEEIK